MLRRLINHSIHALLGLALLALGTQNATWAATEVRFAVVREAATENDPQWMKVKAALRGLSFRIIPLAELDETKLQGVAVLFLPNVRIFSPTEVVALQTWVTKGGKLIVSGSVAQASSPEIQQQLQSLIGAAWIADLEVATDLDLDSRAAFWKRSDTRSLVQGSGVLQTGTPALPTIAHWDTPQQTPAVLGNNRITYLGWQWGSGGNTITFDRGWLTATVESYLPGFASPVKIEPVEIFSMRQELANLVGRVENIARTSSDSEGLSAGYQEAISEAKQALVALPQLLRDGQDDEARSTWESAIEGIWRNYPTGQTAAPPEVRAIWLDRGTIVRAGSLEGLRPIFERLARSGVNTVFFETLNAGYTIYPSQVAPEQNPLTLGWDPLAAAIILAHERKMELHAWCWTFAAGNSRHNRLINQPDTYPGPVLSRNPSWAMTDSQGSSRPRGQNEFWLDPANPEVRTYLLRIYDEILTHYDVDGLQLDYIRYPFQGTASFGFSQTSRLAYQSLTGFDPAILSTSRDVSLLKLWNQYKTQQVSSFVGQVAQQVHRTKPQVLLSAAVYPFENRERITKIQQDWESWASRGQVDMLVPMTYTLNTRRLQQLIAPILNPVEVSPVLFLPSLNLQELPEVQLRDQLQAVRDLPSGGYSLFAAAHLNENQNDVLNRASSTSGLIPYRQPLESIQERFRLLAAEWEYLYKHNEIALSADMIGQWRQNTAQLQDTFNHLADRPSLPKITKARNEIVRYRASLKTWLKTDRNEDNTYRNQSWDNRLAGMDGLLRYSEMVYPRLIARR